MKLMSKTMPTRTACLPLQDICGVANTATQYELHRLALLATDLLCYELTRAPRLANLHCTLHQNTVFQVADLMHCYTKQCEANSKQQTREKQQEGCFVPAKNHVRSFVNPKIRCVNTNTVAASQSLTNTCLGT